MAAKTQTIAETLSKLFEAERAVRELHSDLAEREAAPVLDELAKAVDAARKLSDEEEAQLRLVRIASLLGEFGGGRAVDLLIDVLDAEPMEARAAAGEQLEELAFQRFKDVALGVERALKRLPPGSPALPELPYILAEIPEPGVMKLLGMFLAHDDADAVAAGIETIAEIGDAAAMGELEKLTNDTRRVDFADETGAESDEVTIGELAKEALELLSQLSSEAEDED